MSSATRAYASWRGNGRFVGPSASWNRLSIRVVRRYDTPEVAKALEGA